MPKTISIIVPVYNEAANVALVHEEIQKVFSTLQYAYELVLVNDGSKDASQLAIDTLARADARVVGIELSRNFGKEAALSAGLAYATGHAVIMMDADLQHPPELIPEFIAKWEAGADVVVGKRTATKGVSFFKQLSSVLYYKLIRLISETPIESGATDFRLLDRIVVDAFNKLTERERMTRGLIDWLGFNRDTVYFTAAERLHGTAQYSYLKLIRLAISSTVSHSLVPLKVAGYLGLFIMLITGITGFIVIIETYFMGDMLGWSISGTAKLGLLMIFLIGVVLASLGLIAMYIGNIHSEVVNRPLYVVRKVGTHNDK